MWVGVCFLCHADEARNLSRRGSGQKRKVKRRRKENGPNKTTRLRKNKKKEEKSASEEDQDTKTQSTSSAAGSTSDRQQRQLQKNAARQRRRRRRGRLEERRRLLLLRRRKEKLRMNGEASAEVGTAAAAAVVAAEGSDMKEQPRGHEKQRTSPQSSPAGTAKCKNRNLRILNFNLTHRFSFSSIVLLPSSSPTFIASYSSRPLIPSPTSSTFRCGGQRQGCGSCRGSLLHEGRIPTRAFCAER